MASPRTKSHLRVGDPAPAFTLESTDGETVSSAELQGERYVLYFYPRDNTPGCTQQACDFRDQLGDFTQAGVKVFGISGDSIASHQRFIDKHELNFPLLSDPDHTTMEAYGVYGLKNMYGKLRPGIIRSTFVVGSDGRLEQVVSPVRVPGHVAAIFDVIAANT